MVRALVVAVCCVSLLWGCSCGALSHAPDAAAFDGGLDAPPDTHVPDVPALDAFCAEARAVTATGTVLGRSADRFTEVTLDPVDCEGTYSMSIGLLEAGMPFDGDAIHVMWLDAPSLRGPDPVRDLDVPVSVVWGSGAGPGASIDATMHVVYADPLYAEGQRRFAATLEVDHGSDRFSLSVDLVYCAIQICI